MRFPVPSQLLSTAFLHLHQPQYATACELKLHFRTCLDVCNIGNLIAAGWQELRTLTLRGSSIDANAISCLVDAVWQKKLHLDLYACGLDTAAMAALTQGQWPTYTGLGKPMMCELAHTHFSRIDTLNLAESNLNADAIAALVAAPLPVLADLHLTGNLDAAAAQWLSTGEWNNLEFLDLGRNLFDNEAMHHLARGEWLSLLLNDFDSDGLDSLTQAEWPLSCLYLDIRLGLQQHGAC